MKYKLLAIIISIFAVLLSQMDRAFADVTVATGPSAYLTIFSKMPNVEAEAGIKVKLWGNPLKQGSAETFNAVATSQADAAVAGLTVDEWTTSAKKKFPNLNDTKGITYRVIGHDKIKVAMHKAIALKKLEMDQIAKIFSGEAKSWKEVGGPDIPIKIVIVKTQAGTTVQFEKKALGNKKLTKDFISADTVAEAVNKVSNTPGAVTFATAEALKGDIAIPLHPTIGRPLGLITNGKPSDDVMKLVKYIKMHSTEFDIGN
jgi:hypothetical protein